MELEFLKESIKNCIEIRRTLWTALFGLIGGFAALFVALDSLPKIILLIIDLILICMDMIAIQGANQEVNDMLKKIKEMKND